MLEVCTTIHLIDGQLVASIQTKKYFSTWKAPRKKAPRYIFICRLFVMVAFSLVAWIYLVSFDVDNDIRQHLLCGEFNVKENYIANIWYKNTKAPTRTMDGGGGLGQNLYFCAFPICFSSNYQLVYILVSTLT